MSYTPGPWVIKKVGSQIDIEGSHPHLHSHGERLSLARVHYGKCGHCDGFPAEENARLIAASPEILEMLEELVCARERFGLRDTVLTIKARALVTRVRATVS